MRSNILIACMLILGIGVLVQVGLNWSCADPLRFVCFFFVALLSSGTKVVLPGGSGTMSVAFLFSLMGVQDLSLSEIAVVMTTATLVQCTWRMNRRASPVQILFNIAIISIAIFLCWKMYNWPFMQRIGLLAPLRLVLASMTYFGANTLPVAAVIAWTENKNMARLWRECYFWSFPYYLAGAVIAFIFSSANRVFGWQLTILALPVVFLIYRTYNIYLGRLEAEKRHAEEQKKHAEDIASLHLRTIEALALAIEAKDHVTHGHLKRVQIYALEIGRELGMSPLELEGLHAAALLHDIGKLAVPEHIISKPGRLTPEEFEKMKIHPVVGAEIVEQVQFPYPVAPIVLAHHEKWNGKGYPYGLKGEEIPLGARILSAVDCLDAVASDRQYRRALPLDQAMDVVAAESGISYDPKVVRVLKRRYVELEHMARTSEDPKPKLSTDIKIERGKAPAAGFESSDGPSSIQPKGDFLQSIAAARQEAQTIFEMSQDLGNSLSLDETLSVLATKLRRIIPHDAIAIYVRRGRKLIPEYVSGDDFRLFSSLEIPVGEGLSGWVAENRKAIINGNPSVEPGYLNDPNKFSMLRSALAAPLEGLNGVVGVVALYHAQKDAFRGDHLRILLAIGSKVSLSIENALRYRQAESAATTDFLTGLPGARALFLHLDAELSRCKRSGEPLAVLVCDLNDFKLVNGRYGQLEGDRVLQRVAKAFRELCREYDYVARMGADEFVLVLPGMTADALPSRIEEFANRIIGAGLEVCGERIVSISAGASFFGIDGADAEQLLTEADRRMYFEKRAHKEKQQHALEIGLDLERLSVQVR